MEALLVARSLVHSPSIRLAPALEEYSMDQPRRKDPPILSEHKPQNERTMTSIMDVDDAVLATMLDFLPGHFRFVAGVKNRRFRFLYQDTPNTFYTTAMTSDATRTLWLQEDEPNVWRNGHVFAAQFRNLEALQWLRSRTCLWDTRVCRRAVAGGHLHTSAVAAVANTTLSMGQRILCSGC